MTKSEIQAFLLNLCGQFSSFLKLVLFSHSLSFS